MTKSYMKSQASNPSTHEAEAGGQTELHSETLSQSKQTKNVQPLKFQRIKLCRKEFYKFC